MSGKNPDLDNNSSNDNEHKINISEGEGTTFVAVKRDVEKLGAEIEQIHGCETPDGRLQRLKTVPLTNGRRNSCNNMLGALNISKDYKKFINGNF